jgi:hypothetical protein
LEPQIDGRAISDIVLALEYDGALGHSPGAHQPLAAVIHDDDLEVAPRLFLQRLQTLSQAPVRRERRNDNGNCRFLQFLILARRQIFIPLEVGRG